MLNTVWLTSPYLARTPTLWYNSVSHVWHSTKCYEEHLTNWELEIVMCACSPSIEGVEEEKLWVPGQPGQTQQYSITKTNIAQW